MSNGGYKNDQKVGLINEGHDLYRARKSHEYHKNCTNFQKKEYKNSKRIKF